MKYPSKSRTKPVVCLTIAGFDPSGGAGVIADVKTFSAFGCFAAGGVTSLTFQNTQGVFGAANQTAETVRRQVEPVLKDFSVAAVKTGMLPTREIIEETARLIGKEGLENIVVDPVVRSTSGFDLIDDKALRSLIETLFPLSDLITPNLAEAERIAGMKIEKERDFEAAARIMREFGARNILIKGGHRPGPERAEPGEKSKARDFLFRGRERLIFEAPFIETGSTHGTGCVLASAIAANLALGKDLAEAVEIAKKFVSQGIKNAPEIGLGHSPVGISFTIPRKD
ncbi:MAG: bifunctional hydroxymethylpyrimidine kinase/phosphomethylpyrimidine kinase [Pyrinomonadaceae bacterium]